MKESVPALRVENVSKNFGAIRALNDVSFQLERGAILGLVGDNGAGKSTLLNILIGGLQPSGGEIFLEGKEVQFKDPADAMKRGIAIAYQFLELVDIATVWENFFMGRELIKRMGPLAFLDVENMKHLTAEAIAKYGFTFDVEREVRELSGEERQILAVARAIETNPKILLLDESFTHLSIKGGENLLNFLKKINEKTSVTMIIVSHDLSLVKKISHYILVLRGGEKVFFGHADDISIDEILGYMLT